MIRDAVRKGLFGLDRRFGGGARGLILMYHRVTDESSDPYGLCVSPHHFEEHLQALHRLGRPMHLADIARKVEDGSLPDRAIGVTFDDAYIDVLERGVPLLDQYEVPATVFVTVGPAGREREFWWDELERVFLGSAPLPAVLELEIAETQRRWEVELDGAPDPDPTGGGTRWHLLDEPAPSARHAAFREVYHLLRPLPEAERMTVMDRLLAWAGDAPDAVRPTHRVMDSGEVARLTVTGLVQVGAHTVSHPDLPSQPAELRRQEVRRSKSELEAWIAGEVPGFAYPYGRYDDDSVSAVRDAGFSFACTGDHRPVRPRSDLLLLPRVDVPEGGGEDLARLIRRFLG